ncbi:tail fiber domain-containing protein, partial [Salmonella enterica]
SQDAAAESQASALESKNTAVASKDAAAASQAAAATSETNAAAHADTAKSEAEKAKQFADLLDVNNVLHKDQNLADLPNRSAARNVLQVQAVISNDPTIHGSPGDYNSFSTPLGTYELRIANNGEWRVARNDNNSTSALSIGAGGTGAENIGQARINFQIDRFNQGDGETFIQSPDKIKYLTVGNDGWGYWNTASQQFIPLGVQQGGTAANTVEGAKINFGIERFRQSATETMMYAPGNSPLRITINNDNGWGVWTDAGGGWIPLGILQGGTGATNISQARNNFGIGEADIPVFRGVHLIEKNGGNSGLIYLTNRDANGNDVSNSRIYNEIQGGLSKTTIHTFRPGGGNSYLQIDERGYLSNFSSLAIGMSDHMLGANAIAIGDSDTGFRQNGDGILQALADGQVMFAFTKSGNVAYRTIQSYAPEDARFAYVEGQRRGGANCFVGGKVEMGAFSAWRDRAAGMLVELPGTDAAVNIFKAVQWGGDWTVGMDTIRWGNGGSETHLYVRGAQYTFNDAGYASCVQWVNTSDIRLKANLKEIESAKEKVKSIKGYTYFKRNNLEEDEYSFYSEEAGVIAQDVQTVLPEAVYKISNTDFLGVSYSGVTALLVNAINEMIDDEDAQSKRIEALEDEVTALKSELTDLKVLVASLVKSPAILKGE